MNALLTMLKPGRAKGHDPACANRVRAIALHGLAISDDEIDQAMTGVKQCISAPEIDWTFPRAKRRAVTVLDGGEARAWYDVRTYDRSNLDAEGIEAATAKIERIVREARRASSRPVVLMGFSQGGALALHAGLKLRGLVDGIVALATGAPFPDIIEKADPGGPRIFMGHGLFDSVVSYRYGFETWRLLKDRGYDVEWRTYAYRHTTGFRQLRNVSDWLRRKFLTQTKLEGASRGLITGRTLAYQ